MINSVSSKTAITSIIAVSVIIFIFLIWLIYLKEPVTVSNLPFISYLPIANAIFNSLSAFCLLAGYVAIKKSGAVKLVDRLEFSRANFNMAKDWVKG